MPPSNIQSAYKESYTRLQKITYDNQPIKEKINAALDKVPFNTALAGFCGCSAATFLLSLQGSPAAYLTFGGMVLTSILCIGAGAAQDSRSEQDSRDTAHLLA